MGCEVQCCISPFHISGWCCMVSILISSYHHTAAILFEFLSHCFLFFFFCAFFFSTFRLHVNLPVISTSASSGCMVSGLHSGRDDQGKCVVPWHWSYPSPSLTVSSLHSVWRDPTPSWEDATLPLYPFSGFPPDKCDLNHYPTAPTTVRTSSKVRQ